MYMSFFRVAVLAFVASICLLPSILASKSDNNWIVETAFPSLLRFNLKGELTSSDLSDYIKFTCHGVGKDKSCTIDDSDTSIDSYIKDYNKLLESSSDDSIQSYGTGVFLYFVIAIIGALIVILGTILYIIFFCGCDFFCLTTCLKRKPYFKKFGRQLCALAVLAAFFAFLVAVIILCYTRGITTAFDGISETADAPSGFANVIYKTSTTLMPTFVTMVGGVVVPAMRTANSTVNSVVSYSAVVNDLESLNATVGRLPNLKVVRSALDKIGDGLGDLSQDITNIKGDFTNFSATADQIDASANVILSDLDDLNAYLTQISSDLSDGQAVTKNLVDFYTFLFGTDGPGSYSSADTDGLVDSVQHDLDRTKRDDTPGEGIPEIATLDSAATGSSDSLAELLNGNLNGDSTGLDNLAAKLHGIYDSIVHLPDYGATADSMEKLNQKIDDAVASGGLVDRMVDFLDAIQDNIDNAPNNTLIAIHANNLFDDVDALSLDSVYAHVRNMNSTVVMLPIQMEIILNEVQNISSIVLSVVDPVYDLLITQLEGFNRTIMETPFNTTDLFHTINATVHDAARSADEVLPTLRDALAQLNDVNISSYLSTIHGFQVLLNDSVNSIDREAILSAIAAGTVDFNSTEYLVQAEAVRTQLDQARIDPSLITALRALQSGCEVLEADLERVAVKNGDVGSDGVAATADGDYWHLKMGVCSLDSTVECLVDGDCGGNAPCTFQGVYRCASDSVAGTAVTPCTTDSDCASGIACLADFVRAATLQAELSALADPNATPSDQDRADSDAQFENLRTSAAELDLAEVQTQLTDIQDTLADVDIPSYKTQLQDVIDSLSDSVDDFSTVVDDVEDVQSTIDDVDVDEFTKQIDDVQKQLDDGANKLSEYVTLVQDIEAYIFEPSGLNRRFDQLDTTQLQEVMDSRGFGQTLLYTSDVIIQTRNDIFGLLQNNSFEQKGYDVKKMIGTKLRDPARYMDRLTGNPNTGFVDMYYAGSFYFLMQMSNATSKMMVDARDPNQDLILYDKNGDRYPDSKYCVTKTCFENQQEDLETNYGFYLPFVLIPLAITCLIVMANVACMFVPATKNMNGRLFCSRFQMCWIIAIVPLYLIFSGFLLTFTMVASDGCASGPKIATNYVRAMGDDLCLKLGGNGTLSACRIEKSISGYEIDVTFDIEEMTDVIMGSGTCSVEKSEDPFYYPLETLKNQLKNSTSETANDKVNGKTFKRFRQPIKNVIINASDKAADALTELIERLEADVITCDNLKAMLQSFKDPVCYTTVGAWAWIIACLYLAAWAMCCLGIPAACAVKNHYRFTLLELIEEELVSKKGGLLQKYGMATRRGRGVLARKFKKIKLDDAELDVEGGDALGAGAAYRGRGDDDNNQGTRAAVPVPGGGFSDDPAEAKSKGFFAKYPKVSSKQNVKSPTGEQQEEEAKEGRDAAPVEYSDSDSGDSVVLGGDPAAVAPAVSVDSYRSADEV